MKLNQKQLIALMAAILIGKPHGAHSPTSAVRLAREIVAEVEDGDDEVEE